jgi:hypothetical protein
MHKDVTIDKIKRDILRPCGERKAEKCEEGNKQAHGFDQYHRLRMPQPIQRTEGSGSDSMNE